MSWTTRIVLGFVLVGETTGLLDLAIHINRAAHPIPFDMQGAADPSVVEGHSLAVLGWLLASLFGATEFPDTEQASSTYVAFFLLALPPLGVAGYAYSRLMRTHLLRAVNNSWVRAIAGAMIALIIALALDGIGHWWSLRWCHLCSGGQQFPPARLLNFVFRFLSEFGLIVFIVGALCGLSSPKESWDEYVKPGDLEVGQLPEGWRQTNRAESASSDGAGDQDAR